MPVSRNFLHLRDVTAPCVLADCSETAPGGSVVALAAEAAEGYGFSSWTGACASAGGANCTVTLDADRSVGVAFAVGAVDGRCDNTSVDACRAGGLNTADVKDSDTDHRWRCDGRHGGADSAVCEFPKRGCGAGERNWNLGANACAADVGAAGSGAVATAEDGDGAVTGRAAFKCDDAVWTERAGATCGRECAPVPGQTWSDGEDACAGPLAKTPHLGGATATDATYPATGTATFACNDSVWSAPTADSCRAGCAARTTAGCDLSDTVDGGSSGACASDHTGACAYSCGDGAWTVAQNTCEPKGPEKVDGKCDNTSADACLAGDANTAGVKDSDTDHRWRCDGRHGGANSEACEFPKKACATGDLDWRVGANTCTGAVAGLESGGSRTASDDKGGTTGQAAFKCDDAVWTERPGATCGRECAAANRTWREGSDTCSGRLAKTGHLEDATATDTTYSATGTAAYRCGDAVWSGPADASCKGGCAATTLSNCVLPNTVHDGDAGRCAATHEGSCRYSCGDGNWTRSSNACEPKPVDGVCGTAARDTCAKGVPNTAAFTDSDSQHYWRCDGRHGGKNSGQCPFAKERCDRTTQSWWDGSNRCTGTVDGRSSGGTATATDPSAGPVSGEADYKCDDRRWIEQSGATCSRRCNEDNDHDNCALATKPHGETSGTCIDGLDGACAYTCNDGQWGNPSNNNCAAPENCEAGEETWTVDNVSCTGEVPAANHEKSSTATDANLYTPGDTLLATGSATYQCDDGDWGEPDPQSCHKGCAAKTTDKGCKLPDAAHNKSADGTCTGDYSGSCAYTCDEGDWEETTACSAHCQAAELTWSDGNANCTAGVAKTRSGGTGMASDTTPADTGAAKFPCAKGAWSANPENEGKTCHDGCEQTTVSGCKLPKTAKGKDGAGTCDASTARTVRYKTGACSYTCGGADSWTKKTSCTRLYRVRVTPAPVNGRVTATGINCPGDCEEYLSGNITLTATPNAGYEGVEKWTVKGSGGSCTGTRENGNVCEITVTEDTDVSVAFKQSLTADAGGDADGKYYAVGAFVGFPVNTTLYTATVKASASGGAPPYTFKWSGRATGPSTVYVYAFAGSHKEKVTVEDSKKPKKSEASDTATIVAGSGQSADAAAGGSGGGGMAPFHIPLGGELYFVWGGDGPIRARSGDTGVLSVEVDSPAVRAVGAGAGSTELVLVTRDGELPLPVVVR